MKVRATAPVPAALLASAVLVATLLAGCNSAAAPASPGGGGSASPGASQGSGGPGGSPSPARSWSRHVIGPEGPFLASIIPDGDGRLLGVGRSAAGSAVWSSTDGLTWTAVVPPDPDLELVTIAVAGGTYVAAGTTAGSDGSRTGVVHVSGDGVSWAPASVQPEGAFALGALAFGAGRWVVIGSGLGAGPTDGRIIWTSDDARTWRHVAVPDPSRVTALAYGDAGFVAVGEGPSSQSGVPSATVLTSTDGTRWTGLEDPGPFGPTTLQGAAFADGRYLIGGLRLGVPGGEAQPAIWSSTDLRTWEAATVEDDVVVPGGSDGAPAFAEGTLVIRFARTVDGWLASGLATDIQGPERMAQDVAVWSSSDGRTFRRDPHVRAFEAGMSSSLEFAPVGIVAWDDSVLLSGQTEGRLGTVWLSPARPDGSEPSPRPSPVAPGPTDPCCDATPAPMQP